MEILLRTILIVKAVLMYKTVLSKEKSVGKVSYMDYA